MFVVLLACLVHLLVVDALLAFEQLQTHVSRTEVARYADKVGVLGSVAVDDVLLASLTDAGDADGESGVRRCGVAANDVDAPLVASHAQSAVELLQVLYLEALAQRNAHGELSRCAVHGEDVADVHHRRLVSEMLQVDI